MLSRLLDLLGLRRRAKKNLRTRLLQCERLFSRIALTAEGQSFAINQTIDSSSFGGSIGGLVLWGDGTTSAANVSASPAPGPLSIRLDYSMDSSGFFSDQERRNSLQFAANSIISKFSDQLTSIQPTGNDRMQLLYKDKL